MRNLNHPSHPTYSRLKARSPLVVLCYHGICEEPYHHLNDFCFIGKEKFQKQLRFISESEWCFISLQSGIEKLKTDELDRPSIAVTFDDGLSSSIQMAQPMLAAYNAHATVFIPTEHIKKRRALWYTEIIQLINQTKHETLTFMGYTFQLCEHKSKAHACRWLQQTLKKLHPLAIENVIHELRLELGIKDLVPTLEHRLVTVEECRELFETGLFDFGAHSARHSIHTKLNFSELKNEIDRCVSDMREIFGRDCHFYAYPNGGRGDFSADCATLLAQHGIRAAVTTVPGWNTTLRNPYAIKRFCVGPNTDLKAILNSTFHKFMSLFL